MFVVRENSRGDDEFIDLIEALVVYVQSKGGVLDRVEAICKHIWPLVDIYRGHTHVRISEYKNAANSVCIDFGSTPRTKVTVI